MGRKNNGEGSHVTTDYHRLENVLQQMLCCSIIPKNDHLILVLQLDSCVRGHSLASAANNLGMVWQSQSVVRNPTTHEISDEGKFLLPMRLSTFVTGSGSLVLAEEKIDCRHVLIPFGNELEEVLVLLLLICRETLPDACVTSSLFCLRKMSSAKLI
ncbi:hypothetical protein AVEN_118697-1 [Araneus ventricosus]|uniref:Uncharacterized protein n=1 Tax=Araneus ventricosus TaxID=182803 RepID=A0A4Y2AZQ3_ARAVE|nr:hypothetical protein AVEN_118697-1 [Araneus ventricosus]